MFFAKSNANPTSQPDLKFHISREQCLGVNERVKGDINYYGHSKPPLPQYDPNPELLNSL